MLGSQKNVLPNYQHQALDFCVLPLTVLAERIMTENQLCKVEKNNFFLQQK